jgi:predicted flap endonuclease-1-like 5' DNA nuclease
MADPLDKIEGIGPKYESKLNEIGIETVEEFLDRAKTPAGRTELADETGISKSLILTWANHADLFRISGIGSQFADLLEEAGVNTVPQLAQRDPTSLTTTLIDINDKKHLTKGAIHEKTVAKWIEQAKELPRIMEY